MSSNKSITTASSAPTCRSHYKLLPWLVWFAAAFFYLYEYIARVAPSVMEEELQQAFGVSAGKLGIALATYYFIYSPMQIVVGMLFDRCGGKRLLIPATLLVTVGCFLLTIEGGGFPLLVVARFLMGLGSAFAFVGVLYLATVWFPENRLALISGLTTSLGMLGAIAGESVLSRFLEHVTWEESYFWLAGVGIINVLLLIFFVPKMPSWELDRRAAVLKRHSDESFVYGLKRVVSNPQTWIIGFVGSCMFLPLLAFGDLWGVQYVMSVANVTKPVAADACSLLYFGWLVGAPIAGWLSDHFGTRKKPLFWGVVLTTACLWLMLMMPTLDISVVSAGLFIIGLVSSIEVIVFVASLEVNPSFARGTAVAVINMIVMLVGGVVQPLIGQLLDMRATDTSIIAAADPLSSGFQYAAADYRYALMVMPLIMLIGCVVCLFMKESFEPAKYAHVDKD